MLYPRNAHRKTPDLNTNNSFDVLSTLFSHRCIIIAMANSVRSQNKNKRQRLLLLCHAAKCQHSVLVPGSTCPVSRHCGHFKAIWEHIASCTNQDCETKHCLSSRYVISHYRRCRDAGCQVCIPVKEAIRRSRDLAPIVPVRGRVRDDGHDRVGTRRVTPEPAKRPRN